MSETVEILNQMKDVLFERGWIKGTYADDNGVCLLGALYSVSESHNIDNAKTRLYTEAFKRNGEGVASWNDRPERTFDEVIEFLDAAIIAEKESQ